MPLTKEKYDQERTKLSTEARFAVKGYNTGKGKTYTTPKLLGHYWRFFYLPPIIGEPGEIQVTASSRKAAAEYKDVTKIFVPRAVITAAWEGDVLNMKMVDPAMAPRGQFVRWDYRDAGEKVYNAMMKWLEANAPKAVTVAPEKSKKTTKKKAAKKTAAKKASPQPRKAPAKRAKKVTKASPVTISTPSSRGLLDIPARTRKAVEAWKASKQKHRSVVMFEDLYNVLGERDDHTVYFEAMDPGDQKLFVVAEKMDKDGVTGELVGLVAEQGDEAHEYLYAQTLGNIHSMDRYNWLKANRRDGKLALEYLDKTVYGGRPNARNYLSWAFEESKKRAERPKRYLDWVDSSDLYLIRLPGEIVARPSDKAAINRLTRGIASMIRVPRGIQIRERNGNAEIVLKKPAMFYNELRSWFGPGSTKTITTPLFAQGIRIALEDLDTVMSDAIEAHAAAQASKPSKGTKKKSKKQSTDLDVDAAGYKARKMSEGNRKKLVKTAIVSTLAGLRAGDKIKVTSKNYGDRKVTVIEPLETLEDLRRVARELGLDAPTARSARSAYVTSGKVRPGSRAGGSITWRPRNWDPSTKADLEEEVVFQPTMQQSISDVTAIELLERPDSFDPILETIEDIKVTRGKARKKTAKPAAGSIFAGIDGEVVE